MKGPELEARLVGAIFASKEPRKVLQAAQLHPEHFSDSQMRTCWALAIDLAREDKRTNALAVLSMGRLTKALKDEDLQLFISLEARSSVDLATIAQIAGDIRKEHARREIAKQLGELTRDVARVSDAGALKSRFDAIAQEFTRMHAVTGRRGSDVVNAAFADYERRRVEGRVGWPTTGVNILDKELGGGFPPALCVLLGAPGSLKTGVAAAMIERQCVEGLKPCVFTFEDGDDWTVTRPLARRLGMEFGKVFEAPWPNELAVPDAAQELANTLHPAWFFTADHCDRTASSIIRLATQKIAHGECDCVWIDNARHLHCPLEFRGDTKHDAVSRMYQRLAEFAVANRKPVILLAHTTREYWKRTGGHGPPQMSDISETGDAERDVRLLLALWWKWGRLRLTAPKHTRGKAGFTLQFERHAEAGMLDPDSGELVDLDVEKKAERQAKNERGDEESVAASLRKKKLREAAIAAEQAAAIAEAAKNPKPVEPEPPPQLELLTTKEPTP